jgi:hypothetical protein
MIRVRGATSSDSSIQRGGDGSVLHGVDVTLEFESSLASTLPEIACTQASASQPGSYLRSRLVRIHPFRRNTVPETSQLHSTFAVPFLKSSTILSTSHISRFSAHKSATRADQSHNQRGL